MDWSKLPLLSDLRCPKHCVVMRLSHSINQCLVLTGRQTLVQTPQQPCLIVQGMQSWSLLFQSLPVLALSLCLSLSPSVSLSLFLSPPSLCLCLSLSLSLSLSASISFSLCLCLSLSLSFSLSYSGEIYTTRFTHLGRSEASSSVTLTTFTLLCCHHHRPSPLTGRIFSKHMQDDSNNFALTSRV